MLKLTKSVYKVFFPMKMTENKNAIILAIVQRQLSNMMHQHGTVIKKTKWLFTLCEEYRPILRINVIHHLTGHIEMFSKANLGPIQ